MMTGDVVISGEIASERSVRNTKKIGGRFLEIVGNNTGSFENKNDEVQEKKAECGRELFDIVPYQQSQSS